MTHNDPNTNTALMHARDENNKPVASIWARCWVVITMLAEGRRSTPPKASLARPPNTMSDICPVELDNDTPTRSSDVKYPWCVFLSFLKRLTH